MITTTFEHAYLTQNDFNYTSDFNWLLEQNFDGFNIERKNKKWRIKISHYIGVIALPSGNQLEILPKISQNQGIPQTREWLQQMLLDTWQTLNPKNLPNLSQQNPLTIAPNLPLTDWLQNQFWQLFQTYQPNQHYQRLEQNQAYLQGKLLIKQQLQHNAHQPHKFFHQTDEFIKDTACNRLVKTTLQRVIKSFQPFSLPSQWQQVQSLLPTQYHVTFTQAQQEILALPALIAKQNLNFINFCYGLLTLQQATGQGQTPSPTLLINMQNAFEKWVTVKVQQQFNPAENTPVVIVSQKTQALTADNSLTIKPDIWLKNENGVQVFDIKWKNIATVKDISLADMYQLMTYANEFEAVEAGLIVPTLDRTMKRHEIMLAKTNPCKFYLVPFLVGEGKIAE